MPGSRQIAEHQRDRFLVFVFDRVDNDLKVAELGRQLRLRGSADQFFADASVRDQLFDADDLQVVFFRDRNQPVTGRAVTRLVQNLRTAHRPGASLPSAARSTAASV